MPCVDARVKRVRALPPDGVVLTAEVDGLDLPAPAPFQFYMLSVPADPDFPYVPRPFSVYDAREGELDFLIKAVGPGTRSLAALEEGSSITLAGPLGHGVTERPTDRRAIGVAGGVGIAPFLILYRRWLDGDVEGGRGSDGGGRPLLIYGARTAEYLYDIHLFRELGVEVRACTEDGSEGTKGRVDALLTAALDEGPADVISCGPDPMMEAVARLCAERAVPCRLSLETYMACGYGVCNACAVKVADDRYPGGYRYDRCCVDGPVFDAATIELH